MNLEAIRNNAIVRLVEQYGYDAVAQKMGKPAQSIKEYVNDLFAEYSADFFDVSFLKIQDKAGNLLPLRDNPVQRKIQAAVDRQVAAGKPVRIKIPKARRHGVSTKVQALFFRDAIYKKNLNSLTVCHDLESSGNMRAMFERYYLNFDRNKPLMTKITPKTWKFKATDSSYLIDTASELDTGRSFTIHRLHLSEVAFYADPETLMTGLLRSVDKNPNTMIIAESTANGLGGWWYDFIYRDNDYELLFFPWFEDAGNSDGFKSDSEKARFESTLTPTEKILIDEFHLTFEQLLWRRNEIENGFNGDEDKFRQEYPATLDESFLTSGRPFFPITIIRENLVRAEKAKSRKGFLEFDKSGVSFTEDRFGLWTIFEFPEEGYGYRYVTGSDSAEGKTINETRKDPDNSVCIVLDRVTGKEVAQFCGRLDTDLFGNEIYKASRFYNSACDCVERNSAGIAVIDFLKNKEDVYLYRREALGKTDDTETIEYGFQTNTASRDSLLSELRTRTRQRAFHSDNLETWREFSTFVYDEKGKPQGQRGCHDDRVFASALAIEATVQANEVQPMEKPEEKKMYEPDADFPKRKVEQMDYATF